MKYTIIKDDENECFKIVTTEKTIGTEDQDREWVATAYDSRVAAYIADMLERRPHEEPRTSLADARDGL